MFFGKKNTDIIQADETLPVFDPKQGVEQYAGKEKIYTITLKTFVESFDESVAKITTVQHDTPEAIAKAIHNLKGVAGTLAATRLQALCIKTEELCHRGATTILPQQLDLILSLMRDSREAMCSYLETKKAPQTTGAIPDNAQELLHSLIKKVQHNDASAIPLFETLTPYLRMHLPQETFLLLEKNLRQFRFSVASALLSDANYQTWEQ